MSATREDENLSLLDYNRQFFLGSRDCECVKALLELLPVSRCVYLVVGAVLAMSCGGAAAQQFVPFDANSYGLDTNDGNGVEQPFGDAEPSPSQRIAAPNVQERAETPVDHVANDGVVASLKNGTVIVRQPPATLDQSTHKSEGHLSAIVGVYNDYCDPTFSERQQWQSGSADQAFYQQYTNQLLMRYSGNCDQYFYGQALPVTSINTVLGLDTFPVGDAGLDQQAGWFVGIWLFMQNAPEVRKCGVTAGPLDPDGLLQSVAAVLGPMKTRGDLENVAAGYSSGYAALNQQAQFGCEAFSAVRTQANMLLLQSSMITVR